MRENPALLARDSFYETLHITNETFATSFEPIDAHCRCIACAHYTRAYIRYLIRIGEPLGARLASLHNIAFYLELMNILRTAIRADVL